MSISEEMKEARLVLAKRWENWNGDFTLLAPMETKMIFEKLGDKLSNFKMEDVMAIARIISKEYYELAKE